MIRLLIQSLRHSRRYRAERQALQAQFGATHAEALPVREPVRIGLRLFGLLLLVAGSAVLVVVVALGPREVAEGMGRSCAHPASATASRVAEQCTIQDVIEIALAAPILLLVGALLVLVMRRPR
jgi:hypothetical protein